MSTLKTINYSFVQAGMHPVLVERHITFCREALVAQLGVKHDGVNIQAKDRIPGGDDWTLSCYSSKSETDPVGVACAARVCLPHLTDMRKLSRHNLLTLQKWQPGKSVRADRYACGLIAEGFGSGTLDGKGFELSPKQLQWVHDQASALCGMAAGEHELLDLADALYDRLATVQQPARKNTMKPADRAPSPYYYTLIRICLPSRVTTVSFPPDEYMSMVRRSGLKVPAFNKAVRAVAEVLDRQPLQVALSKAVRDEMNRRLKAGPLSTPAAV